MQDYLFTDGTMDFTEHDAVKLVLSTHHKGRGHHPLGKDVDEAFRYVRHVAGIDGISDENVRFACEMAAAYLETTARLPGYSEVTDLIQTVQAQVIPEHRSTVRQLLVANARGAGAVPAFIDVAQAQRLCANLATHELDPETQAFAVQLLASTAAQQSYMPTFLDVREATESAKAMQFGKPFVTYEDRMLTDHQWGDLNTQRRLRHAHSEGVELDTPPVLRANTGPKF